MMRVRASRKHDKLGAGDRLVQGLRERERRENIRLSGCNEGWGSQRLQPIECVMGNACVDLPLECILWLWRGISFRIAASGREGLGFRGEPVRPPDPQLHAELKVNGSAVRPNRLEVLEHFRVEGRQAGPAGGHDD